MEHIVPRGCDTNALVPLASANVAAFSGTETEKAAKFGCGYVRARAGYTSTTAESLTSSDALTWTLKLRPNIKFSDGTPYDANAVKFNYLRLQDPANTAVRAAQANLISQMNVVDRDSQWVLNRNPNYWRAPQPYVDQLVVNPIIDETQRVNTLQAGGANIVFVGLGTNAGRSRAAAPASSTP
jgi:ABC-type transport system substrate-binding protein